MKLVAPSLWREQTYEEEPRLQTLLVMSELWESEGRGREWGRKRRSGRRKEGGS